MSLINKDYWEELELDLGDFMLANGEVLQGARLHYHQIGAVNALKDNLIVMPTYYGGRARSNRAWVDHPESPLHTGDYCIVIPSMFGAGESSSPSNTPGDQAGPRFPRISLIDNVRAQHKLLASRFDYANPRLVMGWSMGGMQALQWAREYPDEVGSVLAICATARCYPHNHIFLEGIASTLAADAEFAQGHYRNPPTRGLTAFATVYAGWAYSQAFYRDARYRELGFDSVEQLLEFWVEDHLGQDANDLLTQLRTWQGGDILGADRAKGEPAPRLQCPGIMMPSSTDLYFTAEDAARDAATLGLECRPLVSDFGHVAGGPGRLEQETRQIFNAISQLLAASSLP
jgi:homoserine O-acetyltransferase/O-succinyltransferase